MSGQRVNNLDVLRLIAAGMVVLGHSYILVGEVPHALLGHSVSTLAVLVFFALSGYLIARSWMNDPHPLRFALRRARRIWPALILVVLATVLVIGPLLTPLSFWQYITHAQTFRYLGNIVFYAAYALPLVFANHPLPHAVNGSLWTLPVEVAMYALAPLLVWLGLRRPLLLLYAGLAVGLYLTAMLLRPREFVVLGTPFWAAATLAVFFVVGTAIAVLRMERRLDWRAGAAMLLGLEYLPLPFWAQQGLLTLVLPYAVLAIGLCAWRIPVAISRMGDPSYGIYLWSFPVQQIVIQLIGTQGGGAVNFALAMPISLALGLLSWHLLEKRVLGRGGAQRAARGTRQPSSSPAAWSAPAPPGAQEGGSETGAR
ncbi:MAG: acyltransferase [Roseococcus sp.]|nr:acyltransferase [Roseococcus sp.]